MNKEDYEIIDGHLIVKDGVTKINDYAFSNKKLISIEIPNSVTSIGEAAFANNNLTDIILPNSVISIGINAFVNNYLIDITISDNTILIDNRSFDGSINITYKNRKYNYRYFSYKNGILIASNILDIYPNFSFKNVNHKILENIPRDIDSLKGFMANKNLFDSLINMDEEKAEYLSFYKLCHLMGLFNTGGNNQKEVIEKIKEISKNNNIYQLLKNIKLDKYNPKIANFIYDNIYNDKLFEVFDRFYNDYKKISFSILKIKEEKIRRCNIEKIRLKDRKLSDEEITPIINNLTKLKKSQKDITIDDVVNYIEDHMFLVREGNEKLKSIIPILSSYVSQKQFDVIQDIYEESLKVKQNIFFQQIVDQGKDGYSYYWSPGDNPNNFILGYLCDCCARYEDVGRDIMKQSFINPNIKNLIIYDNCKKIAGKATAYYNQDEKYILFNSIEMSKRFKDKPKKEDQKEALDAILRGIRDQVIAMKGKGYAIEEVRIGLLRNALLDEIKNRDIKIEKRFLRDNFSYKGYEGDANDPMFGQAVIDIEMIRSHKI